MKFCSIGHTYNYETEKLIRLFFPFEKLEKSDSADTCEIVTVLSDNTITATVFLFGKRVEHKEIINDTDNDTEREFALGRVLFLCLSEITGKKPEWGILTGIRPAKLYNAVKQKYGEKADGIFKSSYFVDSSKLSLCKQVSVAEEKIISLSKERSFSLYISVPFCPTRCSYCSFVSHSVEKSRDLIPEYVNCLCKEISYTASIAKKLRLKLETVYIGGGTPTTLSADDLKRVTDTVKENFNLDGIREYTVEAGRPDTVDEEKLAVIKGSGATRISINPQTMSDDVLRAIGRAHTVKQVNDAFSLARKAGFDNINMDLIAFLPTDTFNSFKKTVKKVIALNPESITVHTLSFKRSSYLTLNGGLSDDGTLLAGKMVNYANRALTDNGYLPYYMYRQSKTAGNNENVGYAKSGYEGLYNVYIMDETHTVLACGASAVTKLKSKDKIERIFNYKYPYEYISEFDKMLARKEKTGEFYEHYFK